MTTRYMFFHGIVSGMGTPSDFKLRPNLKGETVGEVSASVIVASNGEVNPIVLNGGVPVETIIGTSDKRV